MTTIGHAFTPLGRKHDGTVPTDEAHFESLPIPLALWEPFQQCLSKRLSELREEQIDRDGKFWFESRARQCDACWWKWRQSPPRRACTTDSRRSPRRLRACSNIALVCAIAYWSRGHRQPVFEFFELQFEGSDQTVLRKKIGGAVTHTRTTRHISTDYILPGPADLSQLEAGLAHRDHG